MTYNALPRNRTGIHLADLRALVDPAWEARHDSLTDAFHNYWKKGLSHPWSARPGGRSFDVLGTVEESHAQYTKLHGLIECLRFVALHRRNMLRLPRNRVPEAEYNDELDPITGTVTKRAARYLAWVEARRAEGIDLDVPDDE